MADGENPFDFGSDPLDLYTDRPVGQTLYVRLDGQSNFNQRMQLGLEISMPDNVEADEQHLRLLAHHIWHELAGDPEPETEDYSIDGAADPEAVQEAEERLKAHMEEQARRFKAFTGFLQRVAEKRPPPESARWN